MKRSAALIALTLVATQPGSVAAAPPATAPNDASYESLVRVANQICIAPVEYGGNVAGDAKVGASADPTKLGPGAVLSRILSKLISVNLSGSLKVSGTAWYGILQRDLSQAQASRNACAERVFDHLFDAFHISDKNTMKVVSKPAGASTVYQRINNRITSNSTSVATTFQNGAGDQTVVNGTNNRVINGNGNTVTEVTNADRSHYIRMLQDSYSRGSDILTSLERSPVTNASVNSSLNDANLWINTVYSQLFTEMTPVAAKSFVNVQPVSRSYDGPIAEPLTSASITAYANLRDALPEYLANLKYLMEHDTMDPQNAGN